jgi:type I restriction enzyme S subunit
MGEDLYELQKGWAWVTVKEISDVITGTTPSKSNPEYYGRDFPFFKPTDLNKGYYVRKAEDGLSKEGIQKARLIPEKSILVTCIGATISKTGFTRVQGSCNQQINAIVPNSNLFPEFIYFWCISPFFKTSIIDNASSTTLPILNKSKFETLSIPLPPLAEQHRIVAKIEELFTQLDAGVELLKKVKAKLKRYRQAVLKAAVEGNLTKEWRTAHQGELEPASVLLERILKQRRQKWEAEQLAKMQAQGKTPKDDTWKLKYKEPVAPDTSDLPDLPDGWCWATLPHIVLETIQNYMVVNTRLFKLEMLEVLTV